MTLLDKRKQFYLLHSKSRQFKYKLSKTKEFICDKIGTHIKPYVAYSTGKDSLCLLHLALQFKADIDVMYHDSKVELPENKNLLKKMVDRFDLNLHIIESPIDVLSRYKNKGVFYAGGCKDYAWTVAMMQPINKWAKKNENDLAFIGLRKEESKRRFYMLCRNGEYFYCQKNDIYQCYPLADWKGKDIFAYLFGYNLDEFIHPAYYKDRLVNNPEQIRTSWFCDPTMITMGQMNWLKLYYSDIFQKLSDQFPIIRSYL